MEEKFQTLQYCFQADNSSCLKEVRSTAVYVVMYIFAAVVVILTVCGNLLVIISISHFKQLHTPTNFLVLSLAVADFVAGMSVLPFCLILLIESCWYFGEMFCILYNTISYIVVCVPVYNVVCIAIDRYFAVCDPLLYSTKVTVSIARSLILFVWLFAILYNLVLIYFNGNFTGTEKTNDCLGNCLIVMSETWGVADIIIVFIVPCSVIVLVYGKVFVVARRNAKVIGLVKEKNNSFDKRKNAISKKSERKSAKTLGIVIVAFLMSLMPYFMCSFSYSDGTLSADASSVMSNNFRSWLLYFNSFLNPIIYVLFYPWFQKTVKHIVTLRIFYIASSLINLFPESR